MRLREKCQVCGRYFWYRHMKKFPNGIMLKTDLTYKNVYQICKQCLVVEQENQLQLAFKANEERARITEQALYTAKVNIETYAHAQGVFYQESV